MYSVYCDKELIYDLDSDTNVLTSPTLNLELNKAPTFEFTMPPEHPFYDRIERFKSIIQVLQDGEEIFKGRAIQTQDDMYKDRTVYCEGELAYLNDTIQRPAEFHLDGLAVQRFFEKLLESHNSQVDPDNDYEEKSPEDAPRYLEPGVVDIQDPNDYLYRYTNFNSTMDELKEDLVDDYGGYLRIRNVYRNNDPLGTLQHRYLDYVELGNYGKTSEQAIEFGENLLDYLGNIDQTDICTGIIPLGATLEESEFSALDTRLTIEDVNEGVDYLVIPEAVEKYGLILKTVVWDDVTVAENLKRNGELYLEDYQYEEMVITATALDMHLTDEEIEAWRLGDMILCRSEPHDLNDRFPLAQMQIPLDAPESTSVTLGTYQDSSLTAKTNQTASGLRNFEDFSVGNIIASAVNQATKLINMKTNGYVTLHWDEDRDCVDELLIMDTPDTSTATKVWRWNLNGLGYSKNGYDGDYGLAMTMDGRILGKFITACGMVLANDTEENFGKFDNTGMKIYKQAGNTDLLLMSVGQFGMMLYDESGQGLLASFDSEAVTFYSQGALNKSTSNRSEYVTANRVLTNKFSPSSGREIISVEATAALTSGHGEYTFDYGINADGNAYYTISNLSSEAITVSVSITYYERNPSFMKKNMQLDGDGLRVYDSSGNLRSNMDSDSFDIYDANENMLMTLNQNGLRTYDSDGTMRSNLTRTSFYVYNSDGNPSMCLTTNGATYYNDGDAIGTIGTNYLRSYPNEHGLAFDLEYGSDYMSFAHKDSANADIYTIKFAYYAASCSYPEGVAFGDNARMNNWKLYLHNSNSGGYFQAANDSDGGFYGGDFYFSGNVYSNGLQLTTLADTVSVMLTANGEESEGELSFYSGMKLDVSDLVDYKSSDETLKTSIQPINDARVDNITPVAFKWKSGDDTAHYGYIAQEVREHIPEIVKENDDGLLSLAYTEIIPLLHAKINTLEDRIAKLEEMIYGKESD